MGQSTNKPELQRLLSVKESAQLLGMGLTWMKTQTEIPYVRIGRRKLFQPEKLREYIDKSVRGVAKQH